MTTFINLTCHCLRIFRFLLHFFKTFFYPIANISTPPAMSGPGQGTTEQSPEERQPGFCSATCVDGECLQAEIKKGLKTSDVFKTCNLPKRFEYPHWFNGYGCQVNKQHPFYRTSASEYGWYPPGLHSVPMDYFPKTQKFSSHLAQSGMYRNYSLNTGLDPPPYK